MADGYTDDATHEWDTLSVAELSAALRRSLPDYSDVEDAIQEALVRAWLETENGRTIYYPTGWILRTARNFALDTLRRRDAERRAIERLVTREPEPASPSGRVVPAEVELLPDPLRHVIVAYYFEDLSVQDIAKRTGRPIGTIKSDLHRARSRLADMRRTKEVPVTTKREREGWFMSGSRPSDYEAETIKEKRDGKAVIRLRSKEGKDPDGFGTLMQSVLATRFQGKRIRFAADISSDGIEGWSGLWMRVDPPGGSARSMAFDNMEDRSIKGTTDWARYEVVLDVAEEAAGIAFGTLLSGTGVVFLSNFEFTEVPSSVPTTGGGRHPEEPINLDLSEPIST